MAKKTFVSTADMGPQLARAGAETTRGETREARAAKALGVEILGLARERPLSSTWRVRRTKDSPIVALVVVGDAATDAERELFARMAEDIRAAGDALAGILRVRGLAPSRDAFLTDLWTTGTARDISALKWPPRRRVEFVLEVVRTLDRLHEVGLVHGCLCPANVLLDDDLKPVVAEAGTVSIPALLERQGDAALYAAFAAPEVTSGGTADARSDLFSVGRILDYVTKGDDSPEPLREIIKRCSYPDASARYASAAALATALEGVVGLVSEAEAVAPPTPAPAPAPVRPPAERKKPQIRPATPPAFGVQGPSLAWQPPRVLALAGLAACAAAVAGSALIGSSMSIGLTLLLVVGVALVSTVVRPPATSTLGRGAAIQIALAVVLVIATVVVDPLAHGYRMATERHLHGDPASRRAVVADIMRQGRDFRGLSLANVDLHGEDLSGADFLNVDLSRANLTDTKLSGAEVQGANLDGTLFGGAALEGVDLEAATSVGSATCDAATHLPAGWRCSGGRIVGP